MNNLQNMEKAVAVRLSLNRTEVIEKLTTAQCCGQIATRWRQNTFVPCARAM